MLKRTEKVLLVEVLARKLKADKAVARLELLGDDNNAAAVLVRIGRPGQRLRGFVVTTGGGVRWSEEERGAEGCDSQCWRGFSASSRPTCVMRPR